MMQKKPFKIKPSEKVSLDQIKEKKSLLHYRHLKIYINHGMKLTKLHTVYENRELPWLAKCNKHNADQRAKTKIKFQKLLTK